MDLNVLVGGHITAENVKDVVKTAKGLFLESGHETSKGEGRAKLYNYFKGEMENIKATLTIPDNKGGIKPKYAVLKKFLIGEGIFKNTAHYDKAMVSINHHNRNVVKLAKAEAELEVKQARQAEYDALETDAEKKEWVQAEAGRAFDEDVAGRAEKREKERQTVLKSVLALTEIDNLRKLHREDNGAILELTKTLAQFAKENKATVESD